MQRAINQLRGNIGRVRETHTVCLRIESMVTKAIDLSDIQRAEIVMIVSALDHYVHELVRLGMLEVHDKKRNTTPAFLRFGVSLQNALLTGNSTSGNIWLDSEIRVKHGFLSFQQPDKIADAIRLFSEVELWKSVAFEMSKDEKTIKTRLQLLVDRRNKIAHEADIDPSFPDSRWPINGTMVEESIDFISNVCEALHKVTA